MGCIPPRPRIRLSVFQGSFSPLASHLLLNFTSRITVNMGDFGTTAPYTLSTPVGNSPLQPSASPNEISVLITGFGVSDLHFRMLLVSDPKLTV